MKSYSPWHVELLGPSGAGREVVGRTSWEPKACSRPLYTSAVPVGPGPCQMR
ncbi:MAG: hypothetical protein JW388_0796 [Nitrospira sp.]|nr:hypothetical protein [Nitrospira sp.]